jgi:hypothetical protein
MRRSLLAALCAIAAGCSRGASRPRGGSPPPAEFLVASQDSTFWIATTDSSVRIRGEPITLAAYEGRFYELYSAEDDYSFPDALLVGERLYRRDITTGDSVPVFADTTVGRIAMTYARDHPDERPLTPDEEVDPDPETSATSQIDVIGVFGPYVGYEYHVDVALAGSSPWHATRRGMLDLRSGASVGLADLFGKTVGQALADSGRRRYEFVRDSIVRDHKARGAIDQRGADALMRLHFDDRSFSLSSVDGKPAVSFDVPGRGEGSAGNVIELDPMSVEPTPWWPPVAERLAIQNANGDDEWTRRHYRVVARYDASGDVARLSIADSARREWPVVMLAAPIRDVTWLDDPPLDGALRAHLTRAFDAAASYGSSERETVLTREHPRTAAGRVPTRLMTVVRSLPSSRATPSVSRTNAPIQIRSRKPARNVRADDAGTRQQHGARVRRRHSLDDGQGRGHRGVSAQ